MIVPNKYQREFMDKVLNDKDFHIIYRRPRAAGLTAEQLDVFNKSCANGKDRIQWHAPNWVAMDRVSFEKLIAAAHKPTVIIDEINEE